MSDNNMSLKEQLFAAILSVSTSASVLPLVRFLVEDQIAQRPAALKAQFACRLHETKCFNA